MEAGPALEWTVGPAKSRPVWWLESSHWTHCANCPMHTVRSKPFDTNFPMLPVHTIYASIRKQLGEELSLIYATDYNELGHSHWLMVKLYNCQWTADIVSLTIMERRSAASITVNDNCHRWSLIVHYRVQDEQSWCPLDIVQFESKSRIKRPSRFLYQDYESWFDWIHAWQSTRSVLCWFTSVALGLNQKFWFSTETFTSRCEETVMVNWWQSYLSGFGGASSHQSPVNSFK